MKNRWRKRSPIDLQLLGTTSSLSSCTKSSSMAVWPIRRSRIRPASRLTPSKASRRFTCLVGIPERHQSSRGGGTESTSLSSRVHLLRPAMSNSAAEMSGASKKVFGRIQDKSGATQKSLVQPRSFSGASKKCLSASKKCLSATKKCLAQPRKFFRRIQEFYHYLFGTFYRSKSSRISNCEDTSACSRHES